MSLPRNRVSKAHSACVVWSFAVVAGLSGLVLPAASQGAEPPLVRVLLESGVDAVRVSAQRRKSLTISVRGASLRVGGQPAGAVWESAGSGGSGGHRVSRAAGGRDWQVPGRVRVRNVDGRLLVIALVPLEAYVEGTVGREMPSSWEPEALRAQAIVSRTYALRALREPKDPHYDVEATTASQVYGGEVEVVESVLEAVRATRGQYLTHGGTPILAAFHSASGGRTAGAEEVWGLELPYLRSLEVEDEEQAPSTYWRAAVSRTTLRLALGRLGLDVGPLARVEVTERWSSGRVKRVTITGPHGERGFSGRLLREALGPGVVKSTLFELRERGEDIVLVGSGHGHGVGMSQWGAKAMAGRGVDHREILAVFYPGATLESVATTQTDAAPAVASGREN
ncbi:MAG: SpoIID/LytB domain-containing protein [Myxococcota bacterium]|nr:SpoIID/LytB domain-containing protein [Myxococcota bacterium]